MEKLKQILDAYRNKEREFPSYGELMALALEPREALTDERIYDIAAASELGIGDDEHEMSKRTAFARAIEREVAGAEKEV